MDGPSDAEQRADYKRAMDALANYQKTRKTPPWENRPLKDRAKTIAQQQEEAAKQKTPAADVKPAPEDVSRETFQTGAPPPEYTKQYGLPMGAPRPIESLPEPKAAAPVVPPKPVGELGLQERPEGKPEGQTPVKAPIVSPKPEGELGLQEPVEIPAQPTSIAVKSGGVRTVATPKQTKAKVQWKISPSDELNTSFRDGYEQEYQPRNTDTKATDIRLMQRRGDMAFGAMADSYMAGDGAPITKLNEATGKHDAVTRNHGLEALMQLYSENNPRADEYRKEVIDNAQVAGMTPEEVAKVKNPVLHRVLMEDWDKEKIREFAKEANQSSTARMTSGEIAKHMAEKMTSKVMESFDPSESGKPNAEFVRNLIEHLPIEEKNAFFDKDNNLNQTGERAVRNAVFAKAYPNRGAIERMAESTDDRVKNVTNGMLRAAANVARMQDGIEKGDLHDLSIAEELGDAAHVMDELRTNKKNVQDWLDQEKIGGRDPIIEKLVRIFMTESRRQRLIGDFIGNYAKSVEGLGSPKQDSMFAMDVPTKGELLDNAYSEAKRADEERRKAEPAEPSLGFEPGPVTSTGQSVEPVLKVSKEPKAPKKTATKPEKVAETPKAAKGKTKPPTWR